MANIIISSEKIDKDSVETDAPRVSAPEKDPKRDFKNHATTQEEEDAFDFVKARKNVKETSVIGSIAHIIKGALGTGILSSHVAFMKAGAGLAIPLIIIFGIYFGFCLHLLLLATQILYKRTRIPIMSYSDVGEAAAMLFPSTSISRWAQAFRYTIDAVICLDLFGSCCTYQIIIAKTIKQLVENTASQEIEGLNGYPHLRVYMAVAIPFIILICMIRHLKYLAPFNLLANFFVLMCVGTSIYYAFENNPEFENLVMATDFYQTFQFIGMSVFGLSCAGVVIPVENNMREPYRFPTVLLVGMFFVVLLLLSAAFFGYVAYLEESLAPVTLNFPMNAWSKFLKGIIACMIFITHAINFWVPFNLAYYYIGRKVDQNHIVFWEYVYRAIFVIIIAVVGIIFPDINAIIGWVGSVCLSQMAFIWPNMIYLMVYYERPGYGQYKWRLIMSGILLVVGLFLFVAGTYVNTMELIDVFARINT